MRKAFNSLDCMKWETYEHWGQRNWNVEGFLTPIGGLNGHVFEVTEYEDKPLSEPYFIANIERDRDGGIMEQETNFKTLGEAQAWCEGRLRDKFGELRQFIMTEWQSGLGQSK